MIWKGLTEAVLLAPQRQILVFEILLDPEQNKPCHSSTSLGCHHIIPPPPPTRAGGSTERVVDARCPA